MKQKPITIEEWLEAIHKELAAIKEQLKKNELTMQDLGVIDTYDLCRLLNISARTAATMRENGTLRFTKIGARYYYKIDDIKAMLQEGFARQ